MRRLVAAAGLLWLALGNSACSFATSSVAGNTNVDGEAWYVRQTGIFFIVFDTKVFYCPPPQGNGPATCVEAEMHDEGGDTPMPTFGKSGGDSKDSDDAEDLSDEGDDDEADED